MAERRVDERRQQYKCDHIFYISPEAIISPKQYRIHKCPYKRHAQANRMGKCQGISYSEYKVYQIDYRVICGK